MPSVRKKSTARQLKTLTQLAPVVIGQRILRMATSTPATHAVDTRELHRMTEEKVAALQEGWLAAARSVFEMQQRAFLSAMQTAWAPWRASSSSQWWQQKQANAEAVVAASIAPITRRVSANARRLAKPRKR